MALMAATLGAVAGANPTLILFDMSRARFVAQARSAGDGSRFANPGADSADSRVAGRDQAPNGQGRASGPDS